MLIIPNYHYKESVGIEMKMDERLSHSFSIERINNTHSTEYYEAIKIYNSTTPIEIKTPTNELSMWINNPSESNPFRVYAFVLFSNDNVIGLAFYVYIKETKIIIDEYMALNDDYRHPKLMLIYEDLIRHYFHECGIDISYYITEISNKNGGKSINKESAISREVLCVDNYGKVLAQYYTLPIGIKNHESSFDAFLYIKTTEKINTISSETFLNIVKSIYYDYWLPWYEPILNADEMICYKENVRSIYNRIAKAASKSSINIQYASCNSGFYDEMDNSGLLPLSKPRKKELNVFIKILLLIIISVSLFYCISTVLKMMGYSKSDYGASIGAIVSALITVMFSGILIKKS